MSLQTEQRAAKGRPSDGLVRQNIVLMSGLLTGPVIAGATTFENAVAIVIGFSLITLITVMLCRFIPRKIVYTVRIIIYAVVASIIYIPVIIFINMLMGVTAIVSVGIYLPVLVTNPLILSKTETRLFLRPYGSMMLEILGYIAGFDIVCLLVGAVRDVLINSQIGWMRVDVGFTVPALETTFGGFLLVGVMAGLFRAVYNKSKNKKIKTMLNNASKERIKENTNVVVS